MQLLLAGRCNIDFQTMDGHTELQNGKFHYCRRLAEEKEGEKGGQSAERGSPDGKAAFTCRAG